MQQVKKNIVHLENTIGGCFKGNRVNSGISVIKTIASTHENVADIQLVNKVWIAASI